MAMDTNKRRSAIACGLRWRTVYPVGSTELEAGDLPHAVGLYRGTGYPLPEGGVKALRFVQGAWNITKSFIFMQGDR
jgi:hypothetical protein